MTVVQVRDDGRQGWPPETFKKQNVWTRRWIEQDEEERAQHSSSALDWVGRGGEGGDTESWLPLMAKICVQGKDLELLFIFVLPFSFFYKELYFSKGRMFNLRQQVPIWK